MEVQQRFVQIWFWATLCEGLKCDRIKKIDIHSVSPPHESRVMISFSTFLLPSFPDLCIDASHIERSERLIQVQSRTDVAACPQCRQPSVKVHGFYTRRPVDLPC